MQAPPPDHLSSVAPSPLLYRLWLGVFAAGFIGVLALLVWTWFTPVFHGDLARMARVSEQHFAGTIDQPQIDARLLVSSRFADADVLVLGDSFSLPLRWQSMLVRRGLRVKTLQWRNLPGLCPDVALWARERGFKGSLIIAESVERELRPLLKKSAGCKMRGDAVAAKVADEERRAEPPLTQPPAFKMNWSETLMTGAVTALNMQRAQRANRELKFYDVLLRPFPEGCRYFSHRACDKALLLSADSERVVPGREELDAMDVARRAVEADVRMLWLVVPDKTSVYFPRGNEAFWQGIVERKMGPNLNAAFLAEKLRMKDLYEPDDTHLSPAGYLFLGELVGEAVQRGGEALKSTNSTR